MNKDAQCPLCLGFNWIMPYQALQRLPAIIAPSEKPDTRRRGLTSDYERKVQAELGSDLFVKCPACNRPGNSGNVRSKTYWVEVADIFNIWFRIKWSEENPGKVWEEECARFSSSTAVQ